MSRTLAIDISMLFAAVNVLLILLGVLVVYLWINNFRAKKKEQRKEDYLDQHRNDWMRAFCDGEEISITLDRTEQLEWTIDIFLSYYNNYQDDVIRSRITELAEEYFTDYLAGRLRSGRQAKRQYALAVIYQLRIDAHDGHITHRPPSSKLESALTEAITAKELQAKGFDIDKRTDADADKESAKNTGNPKGKDAQAGRLKDILARTRSVRGELKSA